MATLTIRGMAQTALMRLTSGCVDLEPVTLSPGQAAVLMRMLSEDELRNDLQGLIDTHVDICHKNAERG